MNEVPPPGLPHPGYMIDTRGNDQLLYNHYHMGDPNMRMAPPPQGGGAHMYDPHHGGGYRVEQQQQQFDHPPMDGHNMRQPHFEDNHMGRPFHGADDRRQRQYQPRYGKGLGAPRSPPGMQRARSPPGMQRPRSPPGMHRSYNPNTNNYSYGPAGQGGN